MTCVHHYSVFAALETLWALPVPPSPAQPPATANLFTVSIVLFFPDVLQLESHACGLFGFGFFHLVIRM